jgi:hypothetical protein
VSNLEDILVRPQRVRQVENVHRDHHDRDPEAQLVIQLRDIRRVVDAALGVVEDRRQQERDDDQDQHAAEHARPLALESLPRSAPATGHDAQAETQQAVSDQRAGDLGLDDVLPTRHQDEHGKDQLRHIAERDIEQATDRRARDASDLLGRLADPLRQGHDGQDRRREDPQRRRVHHVVQHE